MRTRFLPLYREHILPMLELAWPIILGQLGMILMGVADTLMVGKLGSAALASANQANNLFFMVCGLTFGVLFSVSTLVSIKIGAGKLKEVFMTYRAGLWVSAILAVAQTLILQLAVYQFHWFGQSPEVNALSPQYLQILIASIYPMLLFVTMKQFTDGLGFTRISMYITFGGLLVNVLLNYAFIYGHWGAPAWGLNGAGYATFLSRIFMLLAIWAVIRFNGQLQPYRPERPAPVAEVWKETFKIWNIGLPLALQTFAEWACFGISGIMVGWLGKHPHAAHTVALNVASFTFMVASGFAIAGSIVAGNAYGEQNRVKLKQTGHAVLVVLTLFELVNAVFFVILAKPLARWYSVEADVLPYILPLFLLAAVFQLADGIQAGGMNLLRSIKDVRWASAISVLSYWVVSLPLSYGLGIHWGWGVSGIWLGFTVGLFVAALLSVRRFYLQLNRLTFDV
ncbi:MAG: MATE family efflux transporter [Bacteroidia bacterium]